MTVWRDGAIQNTFLGVYYVGVEVVWYQIKVIYLWVKYFTLVCVPRVKSFFFIFTCQRPTFWVNILFSGLKVFFTYYYLRNEAGFYD